MLQNPCKTLGFKKNMVYKIPPGGGGGGGGKPYPASGLYRGYIVFAFSVIMFVCLSVCLSKISQQLLDLGLWNFVRSLVVMSCTV